jgi:hypothetical protein
MDMELLVVWEFSGKSEMTGENLPQYPFAHHKST